MERWTWGDLRFSGLERGVKAGHVHAGAPATEPGGARQREGRRCGVPPKHRKRAFRAAAGRLADGRIQDAFQVRLGSRAGEDKQAGELRREATPTCRRTKRERQRDKSGARFPWSAPIPKAEAERRAARLALPRACLSAGQREEQRAGAFRHGGTHTTAAHTPVIR